MSPGRALALVVVGLFIGSLTTFIAADTARQRNAVPNGLMALMQYHMGQARKTARSTSCDGVVAQHQLQRMRALAEDATPIFASAGFADAVFERRRSAFVAEIDRGLASGPDCAVIGTALKQINDACAACHHETR